MQDIGTKVDGVSTLPASEFNQIADELENLIEDAGLTLSGADVEQVSRAVGIYSARGTYYTDGGSANAYTLTPAGSHLVPSAYLTGMIVRFKPANANTGASTVNVNGLGLKNIKASNGTTDPSAGDLPADRDVTMVYDGTSFRIVSVAGSGTSSTTAGLPQEFRLTLTSNTPFTTSDVTGATTLYLTPYIGNRIATYNGSSWDVLISTQISIAVPSSTVTMYDVFVYNNSGTLTLELTAWTNDTTRATALTRQDGILVKSGTATRRYLGSIRTGTSSGTTEDSAKRRFLYNFYHQKQKHIKGVIPTTTWTYTTATYRAANSNTTVGEGRVEIIVGRPEGDIIDVAYITASSNSGGSNRACNIGLDSTTTSAGGVGGFTSTTEASQQGRKLNVNVTAGYHYIQALEISTASGTTTWYGTGTSDHGITGSVLV